MAEMNKMQIFAVAVIALAVVTLMGLAIVSEYSKVLRTDAVVTNSTVTPLINTSVRFGTSAQYPFLQTLPTCFNASNTTEALAVTTDYTIDEGYSTGGYIYLTNVQYNNSPVNCTGTYLADSTNQGHADNFSTGLAIFGTFMAVIVLALVGKIIIGLFTKKR